MLVVEDEALIALDLEAELRRRGFAVLGPSATVGGACRLVREGPPDAAILDVSLGTEKVFPVADALAVRGVPSVLRGRLVELPAAALAGAA